MKPAATYVLAAVMAWSGVASAAEGALVTLAPAKQGTLQARIEAFGSVAPDPGGISTISMPRDGTIVAVSVRLGQLLRQGDAIGVIESAPSAVIQYEQAVSSLGLAEKDLAHMRRLFSEQLATRSQLNSAEKTYTDALAALNQQKRVGADHARETLRAPVPGVVTLVAASPGDRTAANAVVATLATRDRLVVNLGLEPEVAPSVPVGAYVRLFSPQNSAIDLAASISSVAAMIDPQSRLVNAVIEIPKAIAPTLILGMTLQGQVDLPPQSGLIVPRSALMTDDQGSYVYIVTKGTALRRNVTIALQRGQEALLSRGVSANDQVVIAGNAGLRDGTAVRTN